MSRDLGRILTIEVPIIVRLGERTMSAGDVAALMPGTIIELPKGSEDELELMVNNKVVGMGAAVKVGENFGLRITYIGDLKDRIEAMGPANAEDEDAAMLAEALLSGQP